MEETNVAVSTVHGVTDISGVKDGAQSDPEGFCADVSRVADGKEPADGSCDAELEAEFERLISGRFGQVYKKRVEAIVRKRVRTGKAHPEPASTDDACAPAETKADEAVSDLSLPNGEERVSVAKTMNGMRPIENGIGGSCGVVSRINVNALNGKDVQAILKRVGAGERIKF